MSLPFCLLLLLLSCASSASADTAVLRNGQRLRITGHQRLGDIVRLHMPGGYVDVRSEELARVEVEDYFTPIPVEAPAVPYHDLIRAAAARHNLDERLIVAVIAAESNFNPRALSRRGARGLMQLMPATAAELGVDAWDPAQNIEGGARYLRQMLDAHGQDLTLALAAYNAGPQRVAQYGGLPPFRETRAYVRRVLEEWNRRKSQTS